MTDPIAEIGISIAFRRLEMDDIPAMQRWLNDPDVSPWYTEDDISLAGLEALYDPMLRGEDLTRPFVMVLDGVDAGYIQAYVIDDTPDYAAQLQVDPGAVGIDLMIGEAAYRNRGLGAAILRAFVNEMVFGQMDAHVAIIAPTPGNARAIRTYERVGFAWVKTVAVVDEESEASTGDEYVMRRARGRVVDTAG